MAIDSTTQQNKEMKLKIKKNVKQEKTALI